MKAHLLFYALTYLSSKLFHHFLLTFPWLFLSQYSCFNFEFSLSENLSVLKSSSAQQFHPSSALSIYFFQCDCLQCFTNSLEPHSVHILAASHQKHSWEWGRGEWAAILNRLFPSLWERTLTSGTFSQSQSKREPWKCSATLIGSIKYAGWMQKLSFF